MQPTKGTPYVCKKKCNGPLSEFHLKPDNKKKTCSHIHHVTSTAICEEYKEKSAAEFLQISYNCSPPNWERSYPNSHLVTELWKGQAHSTMPAHVPLYLCKNDSVLRFHSEFLSKLCFKMFPHTRPGLENKDLCVSWTKHGVSWGLFLPSMDSSEFGFRKISAWLSETQERKTSKTVNISITSTFPNYNSAFHYSSGKMGTLSFKCQVNKAFHCPCFKSLFL